MHVYTHTHLKRHLLEYLWGRKSNLPINKTRQLADTPGDLSLTLRIHMMKGINSTHCPLTVVCVQHTCTNIYKHTHFKSANMQEYVVYLGITK